MRFEFADCLLDTDAHQLLRGGNVQKIEPMVFDLLALLAENAGQLVTQSELVDSIWGGRVISDSAISACVAAARKAVGDDGKRQAIIRTVPRRGLQFVAPLGAVKPKQASDRADRPTIRYARADDGAALAYHKIGSGPPLFRTLHFPTHLEMEWDEPSERRSVEFLSKNHTVFRYDSRGCGLSERQLHDPSWHLLASDLISIADAANIDTFDLMGMSNGARVAVAVAAAFPERVRRLVLVGGYVTGRGLRDDIPDPVLSLIQQGWDHSEQAFTRAYVSMYFPGAPVEWIELVSHMVRTASDKEQVAKMREFLNSTDIGDMLPKVKAPTLILHSRGDILHPISEAQRLALGIEGSELISLDSNNHYILPHEDDWDFHLSKIESFLAANEPEVT